MTDTTRDEAIEKAIALSEFDVVMVPCPRCSGSGYHHGFGEDGNDPDWCIECGGPGTVRAPLDQAAAFRRALAEAGWAVVPREPTKAMIVAGADKLDECTDEGWGSDADGNRYDYTYVQSDAPAQIYRAMIGAGE